MRLQHADPVAWPDDLVCAQDLVPGDHRRVQAGRRQALWEQKDVADPFTTQAKNVSDVVDDHLLPSQLFV